VAGLLVLGGGRMGAALVGGLTRCGWADASECTVVEPRPERRELLEERFPGLKTVSRVVDSDDDVVLAVKPGDAEAACRSIAGRRRGRLVSIVAGLTLARLEGWLWPGAHVLRVMTNTPALVGTGASAVAAGSEANEDDLVWAEGILSALGVVVRLEERLMDAVTGLSGSGPAYVFLVAEALVEAGVLLGLDREVSRVLSVQTLLGSARMLAESGESAEVLRANVTSPGGTTAAGLRALEERALRAALMAAVTAAAARSAELGRSG
jgi:pyrroline-5-carboxylate reductase